LGLSTASQHFVDWQPILQVIFRKFSILESFPIFRKENFHFKKVSIFGKFFQDIGGQPIPRMKVQKVSKVQK
jgi:hypothetical protein